MRPSLPYLLSCIWLLLHPSIAQVDWTILCNTTFVDKVNGSGIVTFSPGINTAQSPDGSFADPDGKTPPYSLPDASWLITMGTDVNEGELDGLAYLWLDTAGQDYFDDTQTLFDACAFFFPAPFPNNTAYLSQNDPGDCSVMLTSDCISSLKAKALSAVSDVIMSASSSPSPNANLSAGMLPTLCALMADQINPPLADQQNYFPKECWRDFGVGESGPWMEVTPLTGNNRSAIWEENHDQNTTWSDGSGLNYQCPTFGDNGQKYISAGRVTWDAYDFAMRQAWPILTVFFQVANEKIVPVTQHLFSPVAQMSCPRVTTYSKGSRIPPPLPSGTPTSNKIPGSGFHLTAADIGGIAAGCTVAAILLFAAFAVWNRRRLVRRETHATNLGKVEYVVGHELQDLSRAPSEDRRPVPYSPIS